MLLVCGSARNDGTCPGEISKSNSHDTLDGDTAVQDETRNVALAVAKTVVELRAGRLQAVQAHLKRPRPK